MAHMASSATDHLLGKIVAILENEGTAITGVRDEVEKIKHEFLSMQAFLADAEANTEKSKGEKLWVASIRDLAYDVEDIIDEFMYHMCEKQSGGRLSRGLHKTICAPRKLWFRSKIAKKCQKLNEMIKAIPERNQRYGVGHVGGATISEDIHKLVQSQAESSIFIMEDELVGIEGKKQILMGWLMDEEQHQTVISVVGMGGSGKTTLAAKTFYNEKAKSHFDCCAWITVSQTYDVVHLFRSLIKELYKSRREEFPADLNVMSRMELIELLVNYLVSKKYMVVLDDVWDIKVWREIKVSLQDRQTGSRIVLTTRNEDVASNSFGVECHVYHIQPLQKNEAWELFSKKAFLTNQHRSCPIELDSLAWELVQKCEGLPLAIVSLGGLMSSKKSMDQWEKVRNNLNSLLRNNSLLNPLKNILLLSFNSLPSQLKNCLLYCSLFPEDYLIKRARLINLWIAEGFVEHAEEGVIPEEVADDYLMELCFRSMLQIVKKNGTGRPKQVKMHDLMRELALSIAKEVKFGHVYDGRKVMEDISTRRLAIHSMKGEIKQCPGLSKIHSLLVFTTDESSLSILNTLLSQFKLLRSLDLEDVQIDKLPDAVFTFFNLRYLNLKGTLIKQLPESIGRLGNLQFLNIKHSNIVSLPKGIAKLLNLRSLIMTRQTGELMDFKYVSGTKAPSNICKLQKLQCLSCIESEGSIITMVCNLTQLKKIGISNVKERDEVDLWISIEKMTLLRSLNLVASNEDEILPVKAECAPLPHLERLLFCGRLQNAVPWFSSLYSLTTLLLHWSRLEEDLLPQIEALPNLTRLGLCNAYFGEESCFRRGFVKLEEMILANSASLKSITIEKGVMPNLRCLYVLHCMELKSVPQGLEYLSNLKRLELRSVPEEVISSIRKGGVDRPKIQHIPEITHYGESTSGRFVENLA